MRRIAPSFVLVVALCTSIVLPAGPVYAGQTVHQDDLSGGDPPERPLELPQEACNDSWFGTRSLAVRTSAAAQTYSTSTQRLEGLPGPVAIQAIEAAFNAWNLGSNDCGLLAASTFQFVRQDEISIYPSLFLNGANRVADGINEVAFIDFAGVEDVDPLLVGVARVAPDDLDPTIVKEFDIALNTRHRWDGLPGAYDIQNAVTHFVGAVIGLAPTTAVSHVNLTMFARTWPGDAGKRSLGKGDVLGLEVKSVGRPS